MNRTEYKAAMVDKFNGLTNALEAETKHKFVCLENPFTSNIKLEDINKEYLFKLSHLLLQKKHHNPAGKFAKKVCKVSENWMGGGTQCGNTIWYTYMFPKMTEVSKLIEGKKWSQAFGSMLGLFLYLNCNTNFIGDHEVDLDCMAGWFSQLSEFWLEILEQTDKVIGLDCAGGLPGGYRAAFLELLKKQQRDLNNELAVYEELLDHYEDCDKAPIVEIFDKSGKLIAISGEEEEKENASQVNSSITKGKEPAKKPTSTVSVKTPSAVTKGATGTAKTTDSKQQVKSLSTVTTSASSDTVKKENLSKKRSSSELASPLIKVATVKKTSAKKARVLAEKPTFVPTEQVTRSGRKSKTVDRL